MVSWNWSFAEMLWEQSPIFINTTLHVRSSSLSISTFFLAPSLNGAKRTFRRQHNRYHRCRDCSFTRSREFYPRTDTRIDMESTRTGPADGEKEGNGYNQKEMFCDNDSEDRNAGIGRAAAYGDEDFHGIGGIAGVAWIAGIAGISFANRPSRIQDYIFTFPNG